jgi:membrane protease subunit HflC
MSLFMKLGIAAVTAVILLASTLFVVPQTQQALVIQFGEIKRVIREPGLNAKIPFIQNTIFFDKRILDFKAQPAEFITKNRTTDVEERVVIDAFVRYRITDPVQFYQAVKTEANLNSRLNSIVLSSMRRVLANNSLSDLLSAKRVEIMDQIQTNVNNQAQSIPLTVQENAAEKPRSMRGFGIEVVDVRIMRADLPADISQSTYERMRKDFTKEAQRFRAEGDELAQGIRASADREKTEIIANARKRAETIRGEGDAEAARISAAAYGRDPQFYKFYRSMQAYRRTLGTDSTTMVLSPRGEFLDELNP